MQAAHANAELSPPPMTCDDGENTKALAHCTQGHFFT